jgi:hypothetical protein
MNISDLLRRGITDGVQRAGVAACAEKAPSRRALLSPAAFIAAFWADQSYADSPGERSVGGSVPWLVHRISQGMTESLLTQANGLGYDAFLEDQLNKPASADSALEASIAASYPYLAMQPYELYPPPPALPVTGGLVISQLSDATIIRSAQSQRQLYQRMVEFWTDHFNIDITNEFNNWLKAVDDRTVIRANALGTFPALLTASAHSPSMLYYLDNTASTAIAPNENYARELMELHTLGVDGGYTQQDVQEVARCLTGWGIYPTNTLVPPNGPGGLTFRYNSGVHDNGQKTLFAGTPQQVIIPPGGGQNDGNLVLTALINHPSTAKFISKKMCKWLWGYNPPQTLIDNVATTYTNTGGDIKEMIRAIFHDPSVATSAPKYKRPYHLVVAALRATGATITNPANLRSNHLVPAGQRQFSWQPPDGYSDTLEYWVGLILPRWNYGASLVETSGANDTISGIVLNIDTFMPGVTTAQQVVDRIDAALFGGEMVAAEKNRILQYLPNTPSSSQKREALGLAIGSPGYQWY